ncbi:hypothetical protein BJ944DRAFT_118917 [Cunninghamella echinulata]|nr:hypothetical protein BJ944DRAFT_118917 [Cunninghamella echinulata]
MSTMEFAIENLKHHHKPMGHYVQQLVILCDEYIEDNILKQLETCCPYLTLLQLLRNRDLNSYERYTSFGKITKVQLIEDDMLIHYLDDDAKEKEKEDKNTIVLHKISDQFQFYTYSQQSLTELCLQCYPRIYDTWLDYSFFDSIHQSFPQLIKLTIANVHWPNVEDDTWINYKKSPNSLTSLTTLCLDNINMAPPTIFNHITDSYPNLETLEIKHLVFFDETLDPGVRRVYENICGQGIFHMFTTLAISHLKHFILEEFEPTEFWPTRELLEWIGRQHQSIQLKTLSWPYGILPAEYDLDENCGIHFLQQLDTLSFHLLDTTLVNLKSMFNNKIISYNLSSLTLTPYEYTEQKLRLDIFDWLDVFPNLVALELYAWKVYVNTDSNNNNNNSNNNDDDDHHHQQQKQHYPLQKLVLRDCDLQIEDTLTIICQHCPKLKILHSIRNCIYNPIYNILTNDEEVEKEEDIYHSIICAPHLDITELKIDNLRCFYYNGKKIYPDYADFVLNVPSSYPAFTIPKRSLLPPESPSTTTKIVHHITINLNSIDRFYFNGRWALY